MDTAHSGNVYFVLAMSVLMRKLSRLGVQFQADMIYEVHRPASHFIMQDSYRRGSISVLVTRVLRNANVRQAQGQGLPMPSHHTRTPKGAEGTAAPMGHDQSWSGVH